MNVNPDKFGPHRYFKDGTKMAENVSGKDYGMMMTAYVHKMGRCPYGHLAEIASYCGKYCVVSGPSCGRGWDTTAVCRLLFAT